MELIRAYKLSDGRIIEDPIEAKEAQHLLDTRAALEELCEEFRFLNYASDIADEIWKKRKELLSLLLPPEDVGPLLAP